MEPEEFQGRLKALARRAAEAKTPEEQRGIAEAAAALKKQPGAEAFATALERGLGTRGAVDKLTGKGRFKQTAAAAGLAQQMGLKGFDSKTMAAIRKGGTAAEDALKKLTEGASGAQTDMAKKLFEGIKSGDMKKLMEVGIGGAAARAAGQLHDKRTAVQDQMKKLKPGEFMGDLGSGKGRHMELTRINKTLSEMLDAIKKTGGVTDNPQDTPTKNP
jgi:hypothetical protein